MASCDFIDFSEDIEITEEERSSSPMTFSREIIDFTTNSRNFYFKLIDLTVKSQKKYYQDSRRIKHLLSTNPSLSLINGLEDLLYREWTEIENYLACRYKFRRSIYEMDLGKKTQTREFLLEMCKGMTITSPKSREIIDWFDLDEFKDTENKVIDIVLENSNAETLKIETISMFVLSDKDIIRKVRDLLQVGSLRSIEFIKQTRPKFFETHQSLFIDGACLFGRQDILNYLDYNKFNLDNLENICHSGNFILAEVAYRSMGEDCQVNLICLEMALRSDCLEMVQWVWSKLEIEIRTGLLFRIISILLEDKKSNIVLILKYFLELGVFEVCTKNEYTHIIETFVKINNIELLNLFYKEELINYKRFDVSIFEEKLIESNIPICNWINDKTLISDSYLTTLYLKYLDNLPIKDILMGYMNHRLIDHSIFYVESD
jgi:hypothetical protein